jgi:hypothetical protein
MRLLLSILLGMIPEVLYFTLMITFTKNIKEKRIKLFLLISIAYFICILVQKLQILFYMLLIASIYIVLKILYKNKVQLTDVFIISLSYFWIVLISLLSIFFLNKDYSNFYLLYAIGRILLFVPLIFKNKFNILYKKYYKYWNRNDNEKRPIKSITLRNISLISLNGFIFVMNIAIINMINTLQ